MIHMAKYQVMICDEGGHGVAHWLLGSIAGRLPSSLPLEFLDEKIFKLAHYNVEEFQ